ncbi:MAG: TrkA family potassium uptake protein [Deltaproteobacteria bacterium]
MKQFVVIGLGSFGHYLAIHLYKKGHEVVAIDKSADRVAEIKDKVSQAVIADATDRRAMEALGLDKMDAAVICIGSVLSESILATLNMKDIGVAQVFAKAISEAHSRILYKIGTRKIITRPGSH